MAWLINNLVNVNMYKLHLYSWRRLISASYYISIEWTNERSHVVRCLREIHFTIWLFRNSFFIVRTYTCKPNYLSLVINLVYEMLENKCPNSVITKLFDDSPLLNYSTNRTLFHPEFAPKKLWLGGIARGHPRRACSQSIFYMVNP